MWTAGDEKLVVRVKKINTQNNKVNYEVPVKEHPPQSDATGRAKCSRELVGAAGFEPTTPSPPD
jgi:hypothetical protein